VVSDVTNNSTLGQIADIGVKAYSVIVNTGFMLVRLMPSCFKLQLQVAQRQS
jgi:hypothetical protein